MKFQIKNFAGKIFLIGIGLLLGLLFVEIGVRVSGKIYSAAKKWEREGV